MSRVKTGSSGLAYDSLLSPGPALALCLGLMSVKEELGVGGKASRRSGFLTQPGPLQVGPPLWGAGVLLLLGVRTGWICSSLGKPGQNPGSALGSQALAACLAAGRATQFGAGCAREQEPGLSAIHPTSPVLSLAAAQDNQRRAGKAGTYLVIY